MKLPAVFHGRRRALLIRLVANGAGQAALAVAVAVLVRGLFQFLMEPPVDHTNDAFSWMIAGLVAATAVNIVLRILERQDAARLAENYVTRIRLRLFDALTAGPVLTGKRRSLGPMMLRFVTDLTAVRQWVSQGLARLLVASLASIGGLIAIAVIDSVIGVVVAAIVFTAIFLAVLLGNALEARVRQTRWQRSKLAAQITDRLRALNVVQLSGQVGRERRLIYRKSRNLADAAVARARVSSVVRILPDAALGFSVVAILVIGGLRLADGIGTYGNIIAALAVLGAVGPQVRALGRVFEYWKIYQVATSKLRDIVRDAKKSDRAKKDRDVRPPTGELAFERVSVRGVLVDVTATAEAKILIAVVGPSGGGKSALLAAAGRLLKTDAGRILLDGEDVASFNDQALALGIGMVSGDFPLLAGSIRRNLTYRVKNASDDEIQRVLMISELKDDIERLPKGLGTRIGEANSVLPRGLRQRLALARAVFGDPAVLLLDDPDAGLDSAGLRALDRILGERQATVLLATHNIERVRAADIVWYMEAGRILETGTPAGLLGGNGRTAEYFGAMGDAGQGPTLVWSAGGSDENGAVND
ncbi:MAG: ATP-binding cassette domain-containing protein [Rhodospirillales bacterium]